MSINTVCRFLFAITFSGVLLAEGSLSLSSDRGTKLWAAESSAKIKEAIQEGALFLKKGKSKAKEESQGLVAYALLKAGETIDSKEVSSAIQNILALVKDGKYKPHPRDARYYEAGVNLMLLVDGTGKKHLPEIKAISNYLIKEQFEDGSWNYRHKDAGDTSVVQYAILGLWAAERAGVKIPTEVWEKAAKWHIDNQEKNGGFAYTPGKKEGEGKGDSTPNMTAAGAGSMLILRRMLFPEIPKWGGKGGKKKKASNKKFGVLEKIDLSKKSSGKKKKNAKNNTNLSFTIKSLDSSIKKALKWSDTQFRPRISYVNHMYYYYTMERMTALADISKLGGRDWFNACSSEIFKMQSKKGAWKSVRGDIVGTCFAMLFLTRPTSKLLGIPIGPSLGTGLLAGGRGLPDNLLDVRMKGGKVETKKSKDPLSELLAELEKPGSRLVDSIQASVVEKIQIGDPEELIGQRERLVKLVNNKNPEIRRVALWALGRGGNLSDARLMIDALKNEDNIDVLIEARNALCFISHKVNGFGLSASPFSELSEDATQQQKDQAMAKWKFATYRMWVKWYLKVRPYNEKNDLLELNNQR